MRERNAQQFRISASAIQSFKACPQRFRLGYREGLRKDEDTEAQRVGTNWHAMHEVYENAHIRIREACTCAGDGSTSGDCPICVPGVDPHEYALQCVIDYLDDVYEQVPANKTPEAWEAERELLVAAFTVYQWYWEDDPIEFLANELAFELPVHSPRTGLPLPTDQAVRTGKIDHVVRRGSMVGNMERKSTSRSIGPDSDYWDRVKKDTQISMYALAFQDMQSHGLEHYGLGGIGENERIGNTLYDVYRRPKTEPKYLSQKDSAGFLDSHQYYDIELDVQAEYTEDGTLESLMVGDCEVEFRVGKSGKPEIKETPEMYGARMMADMFENPDKYFVRKEIPRSDEDIRHARKEVWAVYQAMRAFDETGCWYENEHSCFAPFRCDYVDVCYGPGADAVCDGETTPRGFKRIFTDLTVKGDSNESTD